VRPVLRSIVFAATAKRIYSEGQLTCHVGRRQSVEGKLVVPEVHPFPPQTPTHIVLSLGRVARLPRQGLRRQCPVHRLSGEVRNISLDVHYDLSAVRFDKEWMFREWGPEDGVSPMATHLSPILRTDGVFVRHIISATSSNRGMMAVTLLAALRYLGALARTYAFPPPFITRGRDHN
jgi:hypothetical protein